jgi:hypothetical protein
MHIANRDVRQAILQILCLLLGEKQTLAARLAISRNASFLMLLTFHPQLRYRVVLRGQRSKRCNYGCFISYFSL